MLDSPKVINGPAYPPPELRRWFPEGGAGELTDAFLAQLHLAVMGGDAEEAFASQNLAKDATVLRGLPAAGGVLNEATVRVLSDPATFPQLQTGEVAVLNFTNSSFNAYMGRCGAIVTNTGGSLSHAAICARDRAGNG